MLCEFFLGSTTAPYQKTEKFHSAFIVAPTPPPTCTVTYGTPRVHAWTCRGSRSKWDEEIVRGAVRPSVVSSVKGVSLKEVRCGCSDLRGLSCFRACGCRMGQNCDRDADSRGVRVPIRSREPGVQRGLCRPVSLRLGSGRRLSSRRGSRERACHTSVLSAPRNRHVCERPCERDVQSGELGVRGQCKRHQPAGLDRYGMHCGGVPRNTSRYGGFPQTWTEGAGLPLEGPQSGWGGESLGQGRAGQPGSGRRPTGLRLSAWPSERQLPIRPCTVPVADALGSGSRRSCAGACDAALHRRRCRRSLWFWLPSRFRVWALEPAAGVASCPVPCHSFPVLKHGQHMVGCGFLWPRSWEGGKVGAG